MLSVTVVFFFFFKQKTAYEMRISDWSSDVCSSDLVTGDSARLKTGRDLYAGVRVGGPITQNVMLYAKGGYTNAKVKSVYDDGAGVSLSDSDELDGYRLGAGVEYARGPILGRLEYRYSSYGKYNSVDVERHQEIGKA